MPDDGSPRPVPRAQRDAQGAARRPRHGAAHRRRPARPAGGRDRRGARPQQPRNRRPALRGSRHLVPGRGEQAHQSGHPGAAGHARRRPSPARWSSPKSSSSPPRTAQPMGAGRRRCWATTPTRAWRSRSRCASTTCRIEFSAAGKRAGARACPPRCTTAERKDRVDISAPAAGHHRRRDGARLRRCRLLRARRQGLSPDRRHRRRQPLRARRAARWIATRASAAPRCIFRAGSFRCCRRSCPTALLAQRRCRSPVHGVRHGHRRQGRRSCAYRFYPASCTRTRG